MMILPSQFDEAFRIPRSMGPTFWQEGTGRAQANSVSNSAKGHYRVDKHHKVAAPSSQPWRGRAN
jgi:hypothetical protein